MAELTVAIKTKQQSSEFVFPGEHAFDRPKSLLEYGWLKQQLAASIGLLSAAPIRVDVGDHAAIKNRHAIRPAIVDAIETGDQLVAGFSVQVYPDSLKIRS